ncbi:MAG: heparin lyase I family protein [Dehalococcoidia bacterium]|nr:heparin lyase I family protein [Dehalococcoidia bacterium]
MHGDTEHRRGLASSCATGLLALGAAALIACSSSPPQPATPAELVDQVTYESGEQAQISLQSGAEDGLSVTHEVVRSGDAAGVAVLEPDDPQFRGNVGYRSEWQSDFHADAGGEFWYGVSVYVPDDWNQGSNDNFFNDRIIFQFHEGTGSSPAMSLHLRADDDRFVLRRRTVDGFAYPWSMPFETDRWYDFVFHVRWSQDDDGFVQLFLDQRLIGEYQGRTLVDGESIYTKWGIYGQPTRILIDDVRIAEGRTGGLDLVSPEEPLAQP